MRKQSKWKFFLHMIPALLGWAMLMLVIWGIVFLRLDDTSKEHKLVIYADCEIKDARKLMIHLEDMSGISSDSNYIFADADIRKIKLYTTSFFSALSDPLKDGDLFILSEEQLLEVKDALLALSESDADAAYLLYADPAQNRFPLSEYLLYDPSQRYYLCLNKSSIHVGTVDEAALNLYDLLLEIDFETEEIS